MSNPKSWTRAGLVMTLVGLLAAPVAASILRACGTIFIVGADSYGCPSWNNGASGSAKIYKDTCTGIITEVGSACVKNDSNSRQCYSNLGYCVSDPWCNTTYTATCDSTALSRPNCGKSNAVVTAVYNPCQEQPEQPPPGG